jgi:plasmid stabilization system protein ParE
LAAVRWLSDNPEAGPVMSPGQRRKWTPPGQRRVVIIYKPRLDGISVLRVRHARSDWRRKPG